MGSWIFFTEAVNTVVWCGTVGLMCTVTILLKKNSLWHDYKKPQFLKQRNYMIRKISLLWEKGIKYHQPLKELIRIDFILIPLTTLMFILKHILVTLGQLNHSQSLASPSSVNLPQNLSTTNLSHSICVIDWILFTPVRSPHWCEWPTPIPTVLICNNWLIVMASIKKIWYRCYR